MGLEPQIIEKLKRTKRRARWQVIVTRVPPLIGITACVVMLVLRFTAFESSLEPPGTANWVLLGVTGFLFLVSLLLFALWFSKLRRRGKELVAETTGGGGDIGPSAYVMFRDALDSVSIGAGVPAPGMLISRLPTVNSLPVHRGGKPHVAFTKEALEAGLSFGEAEAMASQSLAKLMMGRIWEAPAIFKSGLMPFFLLGVFLFLGTMTLLACLPDKADYLVIVAVFGLAIIASLGRLGNFLFYHGDSARCHNDALADSVAVKITGDPSTMRSLIEELAESTRQTDFTLNLQYASRYLFVCPPGAVMDERLDDIASYRELKQVNRVPPRVLAKTLDYAKRSLEVRLENLAAIERGHWPTLER